MKLGEWTADGSPPIFDRSDVPWLVALVVVVLVVKRHPGGVFVDAPFGLFVYTNKILWPFLLLFAVKPWLARAIRRRWGRGRHALHTDGEIVPTLSPTENGPRNHAK